MATTEVRGMMVSCIWCKLPNMYSMTREHQGHMTKSNTVHFPSSSSVALRQSDHPTGRVLKVRSVIREAIMLSWCSRQWWRVWCTFGTTSSPSEWRSISYGNQSGISWRGYTSFNVTCPLRISFGLFSLVSPIFFLSSYSEFLCRAHGGGLRENGCRRVSYTDGRS